MYDQLKRLNEGGKKLGGMVVMRSSVTSYVSRSSHAWDHLLHPTPDDSRRKQAQPKVKFNVLLEALGFRITTA